MSNFVPDDPKLSVGGMQAVIWAETAVAIAFVVVRVLIRSQDHDRLSVDDVFVYFALCCMITSSGLYTPSIEAIYILSDLETGHLREPPPNFMNIEGRYLRYQFAIIILFWTAIWFVKGSFLAFYQTMFSGQFVGWQRTAWYLVAGLCATTWVGNVILQFFACAPFKTYFVIGTCNDSRDIKVSNDSLYYATASDIFTDLLIMALPLSILWVLRLNHKTRVALGALFLTGFVIILFAILRLIYTVPSQAHVNPKWLAVWSTTESCIAVAVSCALPLRKYFVKRGREQSAGVKARPTIRPASEGRPIGPAQAKLSLSPKSSEPGTNTIEEA